MTKYISELVLYVAMVGAIQDGRLSGASSTIAQQYQSSPRSRNFLRCERTSPKETLPTPWTGLFSVPSNLYFESLSMLNARLMHAAANGNVKDVRKLLLKGALFTKDQVMQRLLFLTEGVACGRD